MATYTQRAQAIGDALLNATATPAQINRLGRALHAGASLASYDAAPNAEKAEMFIRELRRRTIAAVKEFEAQEAVDAARTSANTDTEADFAENP